MIAKLTGTLDDTGPDWAIIDVSGVGYLVHCSAKTLAALGIGGDRVTVHTEQQVSENDIRLIGFASGAEREWFRMLHSVQGVGSKMALAVLSALSTEELQRACAAGDAAMVARAQGVGPKLAGRIVNELKDKAGGLPSAPGVAGLAAAATAGNAAAVPALVAAANPAYAQAAPFATVLVAASVVVTMLIVPLITAWYAKRIGIAAKG